MKKLKVLIIDDDKIFAQFLQATLLGFETELALDAATGLELVDSFQPDAIVLDLLMPTATGLSFINEIASFPDTSKIPIVVCSTVAANLNPDLLSLSGIVKVFDKATMQPNDIYYQLKALF